MANSTLDEIMYYNQTTEGEGFLDAVSTTGGPLEVLGGEILNKLKEASLMLSNQTLPSPIAVTVNATVNQLNHTLMRNLSKENSKMPIQDEDEEDTFLRDLFFAGVYVLLILGVLALQMYQLMSIKAVPKDAVNISPEDGPDFRARNNRYPMIGEEDELELDPLNTPTPDPTPNPTPNPTPDPTPDQTPTPAPTSTNVAPNGVTVTEEDKTKNTRTVQTQVPANRKYKPNPKIKYHAIPIWDFGEEHDTQSSDDHVVPNGKKNVETQTSQGENDALVPCEENNEEINQLKEECKSFEYIDD